MTNRPINQEIMRNVFLPSNLNLEDLIKQKSPSFKFELENFKYLIGTVVLLSSWRSNNLESEKTRYVPLNSTLLQQRIRNYNHYLKYLVDNEVLETDSYYICGEKSRGYKLNNKYEIDGFHCEQLTKSSLIKIKPRQRKSKSPQIKEYQHLTQWFNEKLQIDHISAEAYLKEMLKRDEKDDEDDATIKYRYRQLSVERIHNGHFDYSVDNTVRRFHSNLTNLKSELRNFLTYDGKPLCSIDVKNSQPFISTILFNPEFYSKEKENFNLYNISRKCFKEIESSLPKILSILSGITSSIMLVKSHESQSVTDLERYCTLVDKGRLYPFMSEEYEKKTGVKLDVSIHEEKQKLKEAMFITLFSRNKIYAGWEHPMKRFFMELFPTVSRIFSLIKIERHESLPIILQLIESEIMLNRVARGISKSNPYLPIYTVHDSIVTLEEHAEYVQGVVKNEFNSAIGLMPSLSIERWIPSD